MTQRITFRGKTLSVQQWAHVTGIPYRTLSERYRQFLNGPRGKTMRIRSIEDVFRPTPTCAAQSTAPNRRRYRPPGVYDGLHYEDLVELQTWAEASCVDMYWVRQTMRDSAEGWSEIFAYLKSAASERRETAKASGVRDKDLPELPVMPEYIAEGKTPEQARKEYDAEYFGNGQELKPIDIDDYKIREYEVNAAQHLRRVAEFKAWVKKFRDDNPGYKHMHTYTNKEKELMTLYFNVCVEDAAARIGVPRSVYGRYMKLPK